MPTKKVDIKEGHFYEVRHANGDIKGAIGKAKDIEENDFGHVWVTISVLTDRNENFDRRLRGGDVREFIAPKRGNGWVTEAIANNMKILKEAQL